MTQNELSLQQQAEVASEIASIIRSGMSMEQGLKIWGVQLPKQLSQAVQQVHHRLDQGQPLAHALAQTKRPASRSLWATIQAGQSAGRLAEALESWSLVHLTMGRATSRLRASLVYPILSILVLLASLGISIWRLVPQYQDGFRVLAQEQPRWMHWLLMARSNLGILLFILGIICLGPIIFWYLRQRTFYRNGLPRSRILMLLLQAHAADLSRWMIVGAQPFSQILDQGVAATGYSEPPIETKHAKQSFSTWPALAGQCSGILDAMQRGSLTTTDSDQLLSELANHLRSQADVVMERQVRLLPILISVLVGLAAIAIYGLMVFAPWVGLLQAIQDSQLS